MRVLLLSTYELGHQPLGLAAPLGALRRAGVDAAGRDLAVERLDPEEVRRADLVAISVPMHTALRIGTVLGRRVRALNPACRLAYYGLYAELHADVLRAAGADAVVGADAVGGLLALVRPLAGEPAGQAPSGPRRPERLAVAPSRTGLPPLARYARAVIDGEERLAGYVEASTGCKHRCRHCPIPAVYGGRFVAQPVELVLEDLAAQWEAGARHVTFGDPDFLNGPRHALAVARAAAARFPGLSFDSTAKVEHLVRHGELLAELRGLGCAFVVTAVESLSDEVLRRLDKGHTRADVERLLALAAAAELPLRPTLVPFTPWATLGDFLDLLDWVDGEGLWEHVDAVQYALRLLVPAGSLLLSDDVLAGRIEGFDPATFTHRWTHPDRRMDVLHREVEQAVKAALEAGTAPRALSTRLRALAGALTDTPRPPPPETPRPRRRIPRLTEPWFC